MLKLENIIETLPGLKGGTTDTIYDLFFAEKRMIAAIVLHPSDLTEIYLKQKPLTLFLLGNAFTSREVKMRSIKLIEERRIAFKDKTLDEILTMHKASMEIDYGNISSVTIKKGLLSTSLEFKVENYSKKQINFSFNGSRIAEVEKVANKIFQAKFIHD